MISNEEKRGRERVDFKISSVFETEDGRTFDCLLKDISMSGFFIQTGHTQPEGKKIEIHIELTSGRDKQTVNAKCTVIRSVKKQELNQSGMALNIQQMDQNSSIVLFNMVKYQMHKSIQTEEE